MTSGGVPVALADTSVWIEPPTGGMATHAEQITVSIVTIAELEYGANTPDPVESLARRRRLRVIVDNFDVLPLDLRSAELYGTLAELVREQGRSPRPRRFDLLIAAIAARHGMPLLTRDRTDFDGLERVVTVIQVS